MLRIKHGKQRIKHLFQGHDQIIQRCRRVRCDPLRPVLEIVVPHDHSRVFDDHPGPRHPRVTIPVGEVNAPLQKDVPHVPAPHPEREREAEQNPADAKSGFHGMRKEMAQKGATSTYCGRENLAPLFLAEITLFFSKKRRCRPLPPNLQ
ncbi:MAG: hypothetical protein WDN28_18555 [Chthoniobacter sp.]